MVRIDRRTGKRVFGGGWPTADPLTGIIWEAFKPETEPRRSIRTDEIDAAPDAAEAATLARRARGAEQSKDFAGEQGGIY
jgi:penicillin-binding protein 1A